MRKPFTLALSILFASAAATWSAPTAHAALDANSVDFAPASSVTVLTTGISDTKFQQSEARYATPLVGTDLWHGFFRQGSRDINITLPNDEPIQQISIEMMQNTQIGVTYPANVEFDVNINNQWYLLGNVNTNIPVTDKTASTQVFSIDVPNVKSHLIRMRFPVNVWVMARRIHVMGDPAAAPGNTPLAPLSDSSTQYDKPMSPTDIRAHGIHNMLLVYTGSHGEQGTWNSDEFLPMVSYQTQDGVTKDRMFDTMLFLPYGDISKTRPGWQTYINDLFKSGQQLSALNDAVGKANTTLKSTTYKEKVVLCVPYPNFGNQVWGRLNNQTISFGGNPKDPDAVNARTRAIQWYVAALKQAWKRANFKNLQLTGLYWQSEQVQYQSQGELDLIRNSIQYTHANGLPLFWIPYYGATGFSDWKELGFDAAWVQPNFVFQGQDADISRLASAEAAAKQYGMGIEIESPWTVTSDITTHNLYLQMLKQFRKDGIGGNVSLSYYAGSKVMVDAATTENPDIRSVYDETYNLSHRPGTNTPTTAVPSQTSDQNGNGTSGSISRSSQSTNSESSQSASSAPAQGSNTSSSQVGGSSTLK